MGFSLNNYIHGNINSTIVDPLNLGVPVDPLGLFTDPTFPALPTTPTTPNINPGFMGQRTTKTNYGGVDVPSMKAKVGQLHPSIPGYAPPLKTTQPVVIPPGLGTSGPTVPGGGNPETGTGGTYSGPTVGGSNPVNPSPPGTIGVGTTTSALVPMQPVDSLTTQEQTQQAAMTRMSNQMAKTKNTVITPSTMSVPTTGTTMTSGAMRAQGGGMSLLAGVK